MDIVLIPGLWLDGSAWQDVAGELERLGHRPIPLTLPGQGDGRTEASYDDQVRAVLDAVDAAEAPVLVVGHSAACTLAWAATDARPEKIARVVMIGGFPANDGSPYADFFAPVDGQVPFPGWEPFAGPDSDDLSEEARAAFAARAVPVPAAVTRGTVRLTDPRRYDVPVAVICPEFSPDDARQWIDGGDVPELAQVTHLELVEIESGHWPMLTRPAELARLLAAQAGA